MNKYIVMMLVVVSVAVGVYCKDSFANGNHDSNSHHEYGCGECAGTNGINGVNGTDGIDGTNGLNGQDGSDANFNDDKYTYGIAQATAIANLPSLSHATSGHGHTGIAVAFGTYDNSNVMAVGLLHERKDMSFRATVSDSLDMFGNSTGGHASFGAGASFSF